MSGRYQIELDQMMARAPLLPVISLSNVAQALPLAEALLAAGLPVLEVTLRHPCAIDAIAAIARHCPEAIVGAGTVLTADDLARVRDAGAAFAISPGATPTLYAAAARVELPFLPAVATASELMAGLEQGYSRFKFFPAEANGGVAALRALAGPFAQAKFCPTGGIDAAKARGYLALPSVFTVGGSWMLDQAEVVACDRDAMQSRAAAAVAGLVG